MARRSCRDHTAPSTRCPPAVRPLSRPGSPPVLPMSPVVASAASMVRSRVGSDLFHSRVRQHGPFQFLDRGRVVRNPLASASSTRRSNPGPSRVSPLAYSCRVCFISNPDYGGQNGDSSQTEVARLSPKRQTDENKTEQEDNGWEPSIAVDEGNHNSAKPRDQCYVEKHRVPYLS